MYGKMFLRVIHDIVGKRRDHPNKRILIQKADWKSAFCRAHLSAKAALQTITQCTDWDLAFIYLRLTFGGTTNPSFWGDFAETATDLTNALLEAKEWDPSWLFSPLQDKVPPRKPDQSQEKFEEALPLAVHIPSSCRPKAYVYINDTTVVTVEGDINCERAERAILLALEIMGRSINKNDPIPRDNLASISKLIAEAELTETKILLGWKINTRNLTVSLPDDKYLAWSTDIKGIIKRRTLTYNKLDSLVGRLTHVSVIVSNMKHFMSRIRFEKKRSKNRRFLKLKKTVIQDLNLHLKFLDMARSGINMNLLTYRKPSHIYRADACPFGLGGYSTRGRAWHFQIPSHLQFHATINMLEHLAAVICPWIDMLEDNMPKLSCILSMTDSTTAAGWLRKSNFQDNEKESEIMTEVKLEISRSHASRLLKFQCVNYSQWFPGDNNDMTDSLSRDFPLTNSQLTLLLFKTVPSQMPSSFEISPLPQKIESYVLSMLERLPESLQTRERHTFSKIYLGRDGHSSFNPSTWKETHSSLDFQVKRKTSSPQHLQKQSDDEIIQEELLIPWSLRQSVPPWTTFHRPSKTMINQTQDWMQKERLRDFYSCSSKAIKKQTQKKSTKKQSPSAWLGKWMSKP